VSHKKCGQDFGLCYNPDFIAIGRIVHDFLNPGMVLIGQSDPAAGQKLQDIHERLVDNKPEFHRMSYHNAELAKITLNSFCTLKITFANTIAEICENMPGGDAREVLSAVGADSRVGEKYFRGGLAYSGPCFPRDNRAFYHAANRYKVKASLADITDLLNDYHRHLRVSNLLKNILKEKRVNEISFLGLTYKEDTCLIEGSAPFVTMANLARDGIKVTAYDPMGIPDAEKCLEIKENIQLVDSVPKCLEGQTVCFIGTPWNEFKLLKKDDFLFHMESDPVIIDAWDLYSFNDIEIVKLGKAR
jgi:UDPglucose 6-dehydrogenase